MAFKAGAGDTPVLTEVPGLTGAGDSFGSSAPDAREGKMKSHLQAGFEQVRNRLKGDRQPGGREIFVRIARNALHLGAGNGTSVVIGMITLGLMARYLGPRALGILAMIEAYGTLCDQILRLETWQSIVKYGATALEQKDGRRFALLVKFGAAIDLVCAAITGTVALLAIPLVARLMGWDQQTVEMAQFYMIAVYFAVSSTPMGVLRLFDRFAQFAWLDPAIAAARLVGTLLIIETGGTIWAFLAMSIGLQILQRLSLTFMAWRTLDQNGFGRFWQAPLRGTPAQFPGFWSFTLSANAAVLLRKATQELDILVVGSLAGSYQAGIYQIVRKLTLAIDRAGGMLQQVAFPDLARLWTRRDLGQFSRVVRNVEAMTMAFAAVAMLALVIMGHHLISALAGPAFAEAYVPLLVQSLASMLFLAGSTLRPALMCMDCQLQLLRIMVFATVLFCLVLFSSVAAFGLIGAAWAHIAFAATVLVAATAMFRRRLRAERGSSPSLQG